MAFSNETLRGVLRRLALRIPGVPQVLSDEEIREVLAFYEHHGAREALEQVSTAMVRKLQSNLDEERAHADRLAECAANLIAALDEEREPREELVHLERAIGAHHERRGQR